MWLVINRAVAIMLFWLKRIVGGTARAIGIVVLTFAVVAVLDYREQHSTDRAISALANEAGWAAWAERQCGVQVDLKASIAFGYLIERMPGFSEKAQAAALEMHSTDPGKTARACSSVFNLMGPSGSRRVLLPRG